MADITIRISDRTQKVAAVVLVAMFALWGVSRIWASGILLPRYQIQMFLPNDSGLHAGALVTLNGMRVGKVNRVEFAKDATDPNRSIKVILSIQKIFLDKIRADSKASLVAQGLLGDHYVDIQRGFGGPAIEPGGEISVVQTKQASLTDLLNALTQKRQCGNEDTNSAENHSSASTNKNHAPQERLR